MAAKIQWRRDLAANWAAANPILAEAEAGVETDSSPQRWKLGDGVTAWNDLGFENNGGGNFLAALETIQVSGNLNLSNLTIYLVTTTSVAISLTLPSPSSGAYIVIKDFTGSANTNNITIVRHGTEKIEGNTSNYILDANFQQAILVSNGTDWADIS